MGQITVSRWDWLCWNCHTIGRPKNAVQGSFILELFLWCLCLVPGVIYTLWRISCRKRVCSTCGGTNIIPCTSPAAAPFVKVRRWF